MTTGAAQNAGAAGISESIAVSLVAGSADGGGLTDPDFANVSLLLHMDGSNGSTTFTDSSSNGLTLTSNGNAQISTAQSKFGGSSGLFDGTGDYVSAPSSALFNMGGGAKFTIETFFRTSNASEQRPIFSQRISAIYAPFEVQIFNTGLSWLIGNASVNNWASTASSTTGILAINTWYHLALVGDGSNLTLYLDGTSRLTLSQPSWTSANRALYVGGGGDATFHGYIDKFRVTKGIARYNANFTPPTAPFPNS
jgi:hypothetical protein